ncbi:phospholipase D family protein [Aliiroseovarius sp. F47248L]|uniref:phospholipase D family protein n=1 Tax=Aliiroseovarius sp. F47248L TaxID=2926420 RepID=UPI001FF32190|nr:phospholipase D family protein [Aliiroseovarius sp. F47248L]MCK0139346.1 phospholipase D family protein [Aliiroseovarius sp. F47248L]
MKRFAIRLFKVVLTLSIAVLIARLVFHLPDISERPFSQALPHDISTTLGARVSSANQAHLGKSGVLPLENGHDAISSRLALINAAEHSIDVQYYIWHDDISGILMFEALRKAAERGVRVRLLLDDNGVPGLDGIMATLNSLNNFEIRLFNPSTIRTPKLLGYSFDFFRMNRRMHNKALIVDGSVAIIGGRNIGDEYFEVGDDNFYIDMDVLAAGTVVAETSSAFDDYWNSQSVFGVETIIDEPGDIEAFKSRVTQVRDSHDAAVFLEQTSASARKFAQGNVALEWTDVQLVTDDPVKGLGIATRDQLMITRLGEIMGKVEKRLDLVSAYFVPGRQGTQWFTALAKDGKYVRILTNALNTTDVLMVHAGYTKYRTDLLAAGVDLYELKLRGGGSSEAELQTMPFGLSGASLHAKTFALDQKRVFIGSFNFDPRSATLNCEMGFLIDSPTLARRVSGGFDGPVQDVSYQPEISSEHDLVWREKTEDGQTILHTDEPGSTALQRLAFLVLGVLPIEWLL